MIRNVLIIVL